MASPYRRPLLEQRLQNVNKRVNENLALLTQTEQLHDTAGDDPAKQLKYKRDMVQYKKVISECEGEILAIELELKSLNAVNTGSTLENRGSQVGDVIPEQMEEGKKVDAVGATEVTSEPAASDIKRQLTDLKPEIEKLTQQLGAVDHKINQIQLMLKQYRKEDQGRIEAILKSLDQGQLKLTQELLQAVKSEQLAASQYEPMLEAIQDLKSFLSPEQAAIAEILEDPRLDARHKLEMTLPIVPLLIEYKWEFEVGSGINLQNLWQSVIKQLKKKFETLKKPSASREEEYLNERANACFKYLSRMVVPIVYGTAEKRNLVMEKTLEIAQSQGYQTFFLDMVNCKEISCEATEFLSWLGKSLAESLSIEKVVLNPDKSQEKAALYEFKFVNYIEDEVLPKIDGNLLISLDNVDQIHRPTCNDFLRIAIELTEYGRTKKKWAKLRLMFGFSANTLKATPSSGGTAFSNISIPVNV
jgi:hypothetical protein